MSLGEIQAGGGGALGALARLGLAPLAWAFGAAVRTRDLAYRRGWYGVRALPVPVISVGNLVAGGTGKTPFTALLVERLRARGRHPGVLARGYGPRTAGGLSDEGAVLAFLSGANLPQVEDPDRLRGGRALLAAHPEVDVLLLDDGFQHRRLARALDVVLLDATNPFGYERLLPRGLLREPPSALARAGLVVLTRVERADPASLVALRTRVATLTRAPLLEARTVPRALVTSAGPRPISDLSGTQVFALAGLGNPAAFEATLTDLGARVIGRRFLDDHAALAISAWPALEAQARRLGARWVVLTRKDAVKLPTLPEGVAILDVATEIVANAPLLEQALDRALHTVLAPPPP